MSDKRIALTRRSHPAGRFVPRNETSKSHSGSNKVNVALPFSIITVKEPMKMTAGDWVGLAGLVTSVIGFSAVIRQLNRIANASEADQERGRAKHKETDPLGGKSSSPAAGR
jgi:hypothetical protein